MAVAIQTNPLQNTEITGSDTLNRPRPDRIRGKSPFDIRRQKIQAEEAASRERQKRALQRRLTTQGLTGGIAARQQRLLESEARKLEASRKGEIDIQELLATERQRAEERQRGFAREERLGTQQFQATEAEKARTTTLEEAARQRQAAIEQAALQRQFITGERIGSEAFRGRESELQREEAARQRQAAIEEAGRQREFITGERIGTQVFQEQMDLARRRAAAEQAELQRQFQTGERTDVQNFESEMLAIQQRATAEQAELQRQFQTAERIGGQQFAREETGTARQAAIEQAELQRQFQTGERTDIQNFEREMLAIQQRATAEQAALERQSRILEAARQREFQTGERIGTQVFQEQLETGRLSATAEQAELQRQFETGERTDVQNFEREMAAIQQRVAIEEAEKQRLYSTAERIGTQIFQSSEAEKDRIADQTYNEAQLSIRERELAQNADQFRDKQEFDRWAIQSGFQENEIDRAWQTQQAISQRIFESAQLQSQQDFGITMTNLENDLMFQQKSFDQTLAEKSQIINAKADAAYNLGLSGTPISPFTFQRMSELEKYAYRSGEAGKTKEDFIQEKQSLIDYRNALITTLDPDNPQFVQALNQLMTMTGDILPSQTLPAAQFQALLNLQKGGTTPVTTPIVTPPKLTIAPPVTVQQKEQGFLRPGGDIPGSFGGNRFAFTGRF